MDPAKQYPGMLSTTSWLKDFLVKYPYILPCFASSCISTVAATCAFVMLEETAPPYRMKSKTYSSMQSHEHHTAISRKVGYKTFENQISPSLKDEQTQRKELRIFRSLRESLTRSIFLGINMKSFNGFYCLYYQSNVLDQVQPMI